ncbi:unnamed protein product [Cochlearia groenlandica]
MAPKIKSRDKGKGKALEEESQMKRSRGDMLSMNPSMNLDGANLDAKSDIPLVCMFLTTLEVVMANRGSQEAQNTGGVSIRVTGANEVTHRTTFRAITALYGFTLRGVHELVNAPGEINQLWNFVANRVFEPGRSKSSQIHHIAVRYIQKLLSYAFFPRRETCQVNN